MDFGTDEYRPLEIPDYNIFNDIAKELKYVEPSIINIPIKSGFVDQSTTFLDVLFYIIIIYIVLTLIGMKQEIQKNNMYLENIIQNIIQNNSK